MNDSKFTLYNVAWQAAEHELMAIRRTVFIEEQGVSEADEIDGLDGQFSHILCRHRADQQAVACARISTQGKIGRVAVLKPFRRFGVGSYIMRHCTDLVLEQGLTPYLDAQLNAMKFYTGLGYRAQGEVFMDANIPHKRMYFTGDSSSPVSIIR